MSFRLVPKSVTLNDLERRNGPYYSLFHRIRVRYVVVNQLLGLPQLFWLYYFDNCSLAECLSLKHYNSVSVSTQSTP